MNTRLATALLLVGTATCNAAIVRVEFSAELTTASPPLDPAPSLNGYFEFEDLAGHRGPTSSSAYRFHYTDVLAIGLRSGDETMIANMGLVIVNHVIPTAPRGNVLPGPRYEYSVSIGTPTYPSPMTEIVLPPNPPPADYGDIVTLPVTYPLVYRPVMRLSLRSLANYTPFIDDSLLPPSLELMDDATLTLYSRRYGIYNSGGGLAYGLIEDRATYKITSLRTVPEPSAIAILASLVLLALRSGPRTLNES